MTRLPKLKQFDLVYIEWIDAMSDGNTMWQNSNENLELDNTDESNYEWLSQRAAGFILHVFKKSIRICITYGPKQLSDGGHTFAHAFEIPIGCIQKLIKLKRG